MSRTDPVRIGLLVDQRADTADERSRDELVEPRSRGSRRVEVEPRDDRRHPCRRLGVHEDVVGVDVESGALDDDRVRHACGVEQRLELGWPEPPRNGGVLLGHPRLREQFGIPEVLMTVDDQGRSAFRRSAGPRRRDGEGPVVTRRASDDAVS